MPVAWDDGIENLDGLLLRVKGRSKNPGYWDARRYAQQLHFIRRRHPYLHVLDKPGNRAPDHACWVVEYRVNPAVDLAALLDRRPLDQRAGIVTVAS